MLLTEFHMGASIYDVRVVGRGETVLCKQAANIWLIFHKRKPPGRTYDSVRRSIIKVSVESVRGTRMKSEERKTEDEWNVIPILHSQHKGTN